MVAVVSQGCRPVGTPLTVTRADDGHDMYAVAITVTEGPRTTIGDVRLTGNAVVPDTVLRPLLIGTTGRPFSEAEVAGDRRLIEAHGQAVKTTLAHIEAHMAATRVRHGGTLRARHGNARRLPSRRGE